MADGSVWGDESASGTVLYVGPVFVVVDAAVSEDEGLDYIMNFGKGAGGVERIDGWASDILWMCQWGLVECIG